ncbi:uncharacterized protein LOC111925156 [Cyanistes caeruleus]|uniref:uncharacterized protein LOC111925156 n=1 Tax=Cyanistes caeruleus TaxID=156563 RepID=UPI000CDB0ED8|nr:uncharacterized protein LOC111925156 [Cyanistes caeruleus]
MPAVTWRNLTGTKPSRCHSQESSALRRQQLSHEAAASLEEAALWVPLASVRQSTAKMSDRQEVNAQCKSREGQPLLSKRQQVPQRPPQAAAEVTWVTIVPLHGDRQVQRQDTSSRPTGRGSQEEILEGRYLLPHSGTVTQSPRLSVSDLPPLHGPPLPVTPPCREPKPRAASARVKLPPLPAAPAASGAYPRGRAWSMGPVASSYRELVPPSLWGTVAAHRAQGTPSPDSSAERLWRGSAARQGPTGTQPAWKHLGHSKTEELAEVQEEHSVKSSRDLFRGLALCLCKDTSVVSSCIQEQSSVLQEVDPQPQVLASTLSLTEGSMGEMGNSSDLLSPGPVAELFSGSDNLQLKDTLVKEPEEMWEEEELPDTETSGDRDSDPWSMTLPPLKVKKAEAAASGCPWPVREPWDEGPSDLFPTSEPEETSRFSASPSSEGYGEERGIHQSAEHSTHSKLLCTKTEDVSKHLLHIEAEELEKLEEDILSSLDQESSSVPHSLCGWSKDCAGETENYAQLMPPDLFAELWSLFNNRDVPSWGTRSDDLLGKWEEEEVPDRDAAGEGDSEPESALCPPLQDKEAGPAASPLGSDAFDEGHIQLLLMAPPEEAKMLACVLPANAMEEANAACMDAVCSQDRLAQENACGAGETAEPCPVPAQPLACSVPSSPTDMTSVPQPPAPQRWRSIIRTARRALRRLFSFSCLRGQREE